MIGVMVARSAADNGGCGQLLYRHGSHAVAPRASSMEIPTRVHDHVTFVSWADMFSVQQTAGLVHRRSPPRGIGQVNPSLSADMFPVE